MDMADALDIAHSVVAEHGSAALHALEDSIVESGHRWRQEVDRGYKRRTWGTSNTDMETMSRLLGR